MSLRNQIIRDEGTRSTVYLDTEGNVTFGVGHKGTTPLTPVAINQILTDDINHHATALMDELPFTRELSLTRFDALVNMCFTMGAKGVAGFHDMVDCLKMGDYKGAAAAILDSEWHRSQAPDRAERIAMQIETDVEQ